MKKSKVELVNGKNIKIKDLFLFDMNPRYSKTKQAKIALKNIKYDNLIDGINNNVAKKIVKHEGDLGDLYDLIYSINKLGFIEEANQFALLKISKINEKDKFIVADGNRRLLALKILNRELNFEEMISDFQIESRFYDKIIEIIKMNNLSFDYPLTFSRIYQNFMIDDLFINEINFKHNGSGNGKRSWPRGKMLNEIYLIHQDVVNDEEAIQIITDQMGISERKAENDIISAIWVMTLIFFFNKQIINEEDYIDYSLIAPSPLELIRLKKFSDEIINLPINKNHSKNIKELFNINISKVNGKTTFFYNQLITIKNITELSILLLDGYNKYKKESRQKTIKKNTKEDVDKINDNELTSDAYSGLIMNIHYSTRGWKAQGELYLTKFLLWERVDNIEIKCNLLLENTEKLKLLSYEELKEIRDVFLKRTKNKDNSEILKIIEYLIGSFVMDREEPLILKEQYINNCYHFEVLSEIYKYEFSPFDLLSQKNIPYKIKDNFIVSQFAVLRTMYELMSKIIFNVIFNRLRIVNINFDNLKELNQISFSFNKKRNKNNYSKLKQELTNYVDKNITTKYDSGEFEKFIISTLNSNALTNEKRIEIISKVFLDSDSLEFLKYIKDNSVGPQFFNNYDGLLLAFKDEIRKSFSNNIDFEIFYQRTRALFAIFQLGEYKGTMNPQLKDHSILSIALHHIEKFFSDDGVFQMKLIANDNFEKLRNSFVEYNNYLIANWEKIGYLDYEMKSYFISIKNNASQNNN